MKPSIVVDARMHRHSGIGTYIRHTVPRVVDACPDWSFTVLVPEGDIAWLRTERVTVKRCKTKIYSISEQLEIARKSSNADLLWVPHYNIPLFARAPLVVTVHDVSHLSLGGEYANPVRRAYARTLLGAVRRRARIVMFDSEFSRKEFTRFMGQPGPSEIVYLGVDETWSAAPGARPQDRPYFIFVGTIKPHKNLVGLLTAFRGIMDTVDEDLVIAGNRNMQRTLDSAALRSLEQLGTRARFLEDPSDELLRRYVAHGTALVLPSFNEGFGLPALEAMAAGCPCVVSNGSSLPEVGGDAALYCDPHDPTDIGRQMARLAREPALRDRLRAAGRARAATFTWDRTATEVGSVFERALGAPGRSA